MSYFGKFYLVGPEATKAANWLFTADVSKAPGTGSAPDFSWALPGEIPFYTKTTLGGGTQTGFSFKCCFCRGCGKPGRATAALSSPEAGFCSHLHWDICVLSCGGGVGVLALCFQMWLTAGDVMGTGVNQAQLSPAVVCSGGSCPLLRGWEAAYNISKAAASAPHTDLKGKKASLLSPCWCWDIQGWSGRTQAVAADVTMRTNFPGIHFPLCWGCGSVPVLVDGQQCLSLFPRLDCLHLHAQQAGWCGE